MRYVRRMRDSLLNHGHREHGIPRGAASDPFAAADAAAIGARGVAGWSDGYFDIAKLVLRGVGHRVLLEMPAAASDEQLSSSPLVHLARDEKSRWQLTQSHTSPTPRGRELEYFRCWLRQPSARSRKGEAYDVLHAALRAPLALPPGERTPAQLRHACEQVDAIAARYGKPRPPPHAAPSDAGGPPPVDPLAQSPFGRAALATIRVTGGDGRQPLEADGLTLCVANALVCEVRRRAKSGGARPLLPRETVAAALAKLEQSRWRARQGAVAPSDADAAAWCEWFAAQPEPREWSTPSWHARVWAGEDERQRACALMRALRHARADTADALIGSPLLDVLRDFPRDRRPGAIDPLRDASTETLRRVALVESEAAPPVRGGQERS